MSRTFDQDDDKLFVRRCAFAEYEAALKFEKRSRKKTTSMRKDMLKSMQLPELETHAIAMGATREEVGIAKDDYDPKASLVHLNLNLLKARRARSKALNAGVSHVPSFEDLVPTAWCELKKWLRLFVVFVSSVMVAGFIPGQALFIQLFIDFGVGASNCEKGQLNCHKQQLVVSLGFNIGQVLSQFGLLIGGWLFDRFGGRFCSVVGGATTMLGLILLEAPLFAVQLGYDETTWWMLPIVICLVDAGSVLGCYSVMSLSYHFPNFQSFIVSLWGVSFTMPALLPNAFIFAMSSSGCNLPSVFGLYTLIVGCATVGLFFCVPTQQEYLQEGKRVLGVPFPILAQRSSFLKDCLRGFEVCRAHSGSHLAFAIFCALLFSAMTMHLSLMGEYMEVLLGSRSAGNELTSLVTLLQGTVGSLLCVLICITSDWVGHSSLIMILLFLTALVVVLIFEVASAHWSQQLFVVICVVAIQTLGVPVMGKYCLSFCLPTQLGMFLGVLNTLIMGCTCVVMVGYYTWLSSIVPDQMPAFMTEIYTLTAISMILYTAWFAWLGLPEFPVLLPSDEEVLAGRFGCKTFDEVLYVTHMMNKSELLRILCTSDAALMDSLVALVDPERQAKVVEKYSKGHPSQASLLQYLFPSFFVSDVPEADEKHPLGIPLLNAKADDSPGWYRIAGYDGLQLRATPSLDSTYIGTIAAGTSVRVLEVVNQGDRIRGRIGSPNGGRDGWISLLDTTKGFRFAERDSLSQETFATSICGSWQSFFGESTPDPHSESDVAAACPDATSAECKAFLLKYIQVEPAAKALNDHLIWRKTVLQAYPTLVEYHRRWVEKGIYPRPFIRVVPDDRCRRNPDRPVTLLANGLLLAPGNNARDHSGYVARVLEALLPRNVNRRVVIVMCVEPNEKDVPSEEFGINCVSALEMLPWCRDVCSMLCTNFPDRLAAFFLFPVPGIISTLWTTTLQPFMDPMIFEKMKFRGSESGDNEFPEEIASFLGGGLRSECQSVMDQWRRDQWIAFKNRTRCK